MDIGRMLTWTADRYPGRRGRWPPAADLAAVGRPHQPAGPGAGRVSASGPATGWRSCWPAASRWPACIWRWPKLGAAAVPLSVRFGPAELAYCVNDAEPAMVSVTTPPASLAGALTTARRTGPRRTRPAGPARTRRRAEPRPQPEDLSVILYTSGTTGRPKGVPRTHRAEHAAAVAHVIQTQHRPGEVTLGVMPLFHTMGVRTLLASILVAGTWVPQAGFDADKSLELIARDKSPRCTWCRRSTGPCCAPAA